MKKLDFRLFVLLTLSLFLSCKAQNNDDNIKGIPKEAKKYIITASYEPILFNGDWVCGQEFTTDFDYLRDTTYYDEFSNVLMVKNRISITRNIYISPKEHKIQKSYNISYSSDKKQFSDRQICQIYIRDEKGNLIEIKEEEEYNSKKSEKSIYTYKYDNQGNRIEEVDNDRSLVKTINTHTENGTLKISTFKTVNIGDSNYCKGIKGLVSSGMSITDLKTNLLQKQTTESYSNGDIESYDEETYLYNKNNRILKRIRNSIRTIESRSILDDKITDIEKQKSKLVGLYNEHEDIISTIYYTPDVFYGKLEINSGLSKRFIYIYNSHGDWIKRIEYPIISPKKNNNDNKLRSTVFDDVDPNTPITITVRKIEYYK